MKSEFLNKVTLYIKHMFTIDKIVCLFQGVLYKGI